MKPLYLVGTQSDVGKTTFSIGLGNALSRRGLRVAYCKPLGQRIKKVGGAARHDDALVVFGSMGLSEQETSEAMVPLYRGRTEEEIFHPHTEELAKKVGEACQRLRAESDVLIVEAMGHVALGACIGLSAAEIAKLIDAKVMIVSGGGIGRAIDEISLCATYMTARGAQLTGAVINKVWTEKYDRVKRATDQGLKNIGITPLGVAPYREILASPTMRQVAEQLEADVLCGEEALDSRVHKTIVAAMEPENVMSFLEDRALVITPGDREDNILAVLAMHALEPRPARPVAGLLLTGGFRPKGKVLDLLAHAGLPTLLCAADTYTLASRLQGLIFKITPDDHERIDAAIELVKYVDVDRILDVLNE